MPRFSTFDRDRTMWGNRQLRCGPAMRGGYWYSSICISHRNGKYWQDVMGKGLWSSIPYGDAACVPWEPISVCRGIVKVTMKVKPL